MDRKPEGIEMSETESDSLELERCVREELSKQSTRSRKVRSASGAADSTVPSTSRASVTMCRPSLRKKGRTGRAARKQHSKNVSTAKIESSSVPAVPPVQETDYLKPFEKGWVREMVRRAVVSKSTAADIYYTSPDGIKFRSGKEIERFFKANPEKAAGLRSDYFTFKRILLGWNGPEEFVRKAGSGYSDQKRVGRRISSKSMKA
ncbi:hypothetical protein M514_01745 [Trichuris suis]|uniref:MBD domain-containing protein n=1 Tax=Trichuris suis TaxID=68888 RepID=A0A085NT29_9BILA|nr:hypothetical protein M513_01745 [Trichuris suis]KFD72625.1 hypothetical protein M514_01745 [Trichuris suis]